MLFRAQAVGVATQMLSSRPRMRGRKTTDYNYSLGTVCRSQKPPS